MNAESIMKMVADAHGISVQDLKTKPGKRYSIPRNESVYCMREHLDTYSFQDINDLFNFKSKSSSQKSYNSVKVHMAKNSNMKNRVETYLKTLKGETTNEGKLSVS